LLKYGKSAYNHSNEKPPNEETMEDNHQDFDEFDEEEEDENEEGFAEMLEQSLLGAKQLKPGQKVVATVLQIGKDWVFLDVGQKGEGVLDAKELRDDEGQVEVAVGDKLTTYFLSAAGGELRFTTRLGAGAAGAAQIEEAWQGGIPVEGRLEKEVKGGFEVRLPGGMRAFCPFSQLGLRREDYPDTVVGQTRSFKVLQFSEQGRNVVVSHRAILEEARAQQREALKETLKEGMVVKGIVTSLRDFGAFVDIGGIDGLLPISEVSYGRVENLGEVLRVGQELELAIKKLDWEANRFSFSLRDTLADPWKKVGSVYVEGGTYPGIVARVVPFGAFVTLEEGIDGLVHISRLGGGRRLKHASEVLKTGEALTVTVEKIDQDQRRISLVPITEESSEPQAAEKVPIPTSPTPTVQTEKPAESSMGTLGDMLKKKLDKQQKKS
jgi:small subunit ribosomal protein S1